jgi:hypothetical protein
VAEQVPFFSKALTALVKRLEAVAEENEEVAVLEMEPDWISPIGCEKQALLRLMTIQQFLLDHPAIYVFDDEAVSCVADACQLLGHRRAWIGSVHLEGNRPEEDHLLIKSTFPEGLFSPDIMDLTDDTAQMSLAEVSDRIQTVRLARLKFHDSTFVAETTGASRLWRLAQGLARRRVALFAVPGPADAPAVTVTIEGPFSHQSAWQACGLRHWARTEQQFARTPSSSSTGEDVSTPSEESITPSGSLRSSDGLLTSSSDGLSSDLERQLSLSSPEL